MTVLDTSALVDLLVGGEAHAQVAELLEREGAAAAPDLIVFETLAVLRRAVHRNSLDAARAAAALEDLADVALELFPSLPLRLRAWDLRENLTAADALFVALAQELDEPLATKDRPLSEAAQALGVQTLYLG